LGTPEVQQLDALEELDVQSLQAAPYVAGDGGASGAGVLPVPDEPEALPRSHELLQLALQVGLAANDEPPALEVLEVLVLGQRLLGCRPRLEVEGGGEP
jgi:hypothetical protein